MPKFQDSPHKEEAMQALTHGMPIEECAIRFGLSERTVQRYVQALKYPLAAKESRVNQRLSEKARNAVKNGNNKQPQVQVIIEIRITLVDSNKVRRHG